MRSHRIARLAIVVPIISDSVFVTVFTISQHHSDFSFINYSSNMNPLHTETQSSFRIIDLTAHNTEGEIDS